MDHKMMDAIDAGYW